MNRSLWKHDLAWAGFILALASLMGVFQHRMLVRQAIKGELTGHLDKVREERRAAQFQGIVTVNLAQAYELFQQGQTLFLDARSSDEYRELHIPSAVNLPPELLAKEGGAKLEGIPRERQILVYCSQTECDAALKVAEKLEALGFTRVMVFLAGFRAWDEAGYPVDLSR